MQVVEEFKNNKGVAFGDVVLQQVPCCALCRLGAIDSYDDGSHDRFYPLCSPEYEPSTAKISLRSARAFALRLIGQSRRQPPSRAHTSHKRERTHARTRRS